VGVQYPKYTRDNCVNIRPRKLIIISEISELGQEMEDAASRKKCLIVHFLSKNRELDMCNCCWE
jgi:hypothetical protein